ncbi:MAG: hypothetical protein H6799_02610 [Candidatus Nomurabacteria bacterium]|nr:MAG: hypothetical protein H6799_02610 [Candidatus Nomurabacteria bacterium]HRV76320.1 hypothetical protein [Candidatus Saccharimonadales bacterium]
MANLITTRRTILGQLNGLSGNRFHYPSPSGSETVAGIGAFVEDEKRDCSSEECSLMPWVQVSLNERTVSPGLFCARGCGRLTESAVRLRDILEN